MKTSRTQTRRLFQVALWAALGSTMAGAARGDGPVTLRWALRAGETLRYEFRQKNDITIQTEGQKTANTSDLRIELTWSVKALAADGTAEIEQTVDRVRSSIQNGSQKIRYDSKESAKDSDPSAEALRRVYRAVIAAPTTLKLDPSGRVVAAEVPGAVTEALRGSPFQGIADGGSVFTETGLKNLFAQVIPVLPEKPITPETTWDQTLKLPSSPLVLTLQERFHLTETQEKSATIEAAIASAIQPEPGSGFTVALKKESGSGTYQFDTQGGRVTDASVHQSIEMRLMFMGQPIDEVIAMDLTLKRINSDDG